jgi:hypothetical protein
VQGCALTIATITTADPLHACSCAHTHIHRLSSTRCPSTSRLREERHCTHLASASLLAAVTSGCASLTLRLVLSWSVSRAITGLFAACATSLAARAMQLDRRTGPSVCGLTTTTRQRQQRQRRQDRQGRRQAFCSQQRSGGEPGAAECGREQSQSGRGEQRRRGTVVLQCGGWSASLLVGDAQVVKQQSRAWQGGSLKAGGAWSRSIMLCACAIVAFTQVHICTLKHTHIASRQQHWRSATINRSCMFRAAALVLHCTC